jgi:metallophosphoesterase (TIGR00282 family)
MFSLGIDALTTGNHVWDRREAIDYLAEGPPVIRPLNYPPGTPGRGCTEIAVDGQTLSVVNVQGRVFMRGLDDPFRSMDSLLSSVPDGHHILVDMHAEATSEKAALAFYLDGRISALVGTHTHVPTADARILPKGTAFITDVGMVGGRDSIIGVESESVIQHFLTQMYHRYQVARGPVAFNAVFIDTDDSGRATNIELIQEIVAA